MKQYVFGAMLGLILAGTAPVLVQAQESSSSPAPQKTNGPVSGVVAGSPGVSQMPVAGAGKVTMWGTELTQGGLALPAGGTLSLKEALQRANYHATPLKAGRPQFIIYRSDHQKQIVNFSALSDGKPDVLLYDGDYVMATMEMLDHATILGDVKTGDSLYFGKDEQPTLADLVQFAGGMTDESANDSVTIVHLNFLHDAKDKITMRSSFGDRFDATLDPADPRWQQKIGNNDWVFVYSKKLTLNQIWPLFETQDAH